MSLEQHREQLNIHNRKGEISFAAALQTTSETSEADISEFRYHKPRKTKANKYDFESPTSQSINQFKSKNMNLISTKSI